MTSEILVFKEQRQKGRETEWEMGEIQSKISGVCKFEPKEKDNKNTHRWMENTEVFSTIQWEASTFTPTYPHINAYIDADITQIQHPNSNLDPGFSQYGSIK